MTRNTRTSTALLALFLAAAATAQAQSTTLTLTGKLRDFKEVNNTDNTNTHPDFNDRLCNGRGAVDTLISTSGFLGDTAIFNFDNREPILRNLNGATGQRCYESIPYFTDWYNDRIVPDNAPVRSMNRPFLMQLQFTRDPNDTNLYVYDDQTFFPMDNRSAGGIWQVIPGGPTTPFGHLNAAPNNNHNFGFTMEFHARFTYVAGTNQTFSFRGDDDVWVFVNGKLAIDLGGVHGAETGSFNLDAIAARHGLVNGGEYILDFFFAERHVVESSVRITTTILLNRPVKVATPVATPTGRPFTSFQDVTLSTATQGATIHYTLNGANPDSTSPIYTPGTVLNLIANTTIRAIAYRPGWIKSDIMVETYTKLFNASILDILDANGNPLVGGYLTERNGTYMVRVTTTQAGLGSINPVATTKTAGDREILTITDRTQSVDRFMYQGTVVLAISAAAANGRTDASAYDSLTVVWKNPLDTVNDVATKKVLVRPFPIQATAYFSKSPTGADTTDQFVGNETVIYLIVRDQTLPPGATPTATLTTLPLVGGAAAADTGTFALTPIASRPGYMVATIPIATTGGPVPGNGTLRVSLSDQITGTYRDPVDAENPAVANAGFGVAPNIDGSLQFTDANFIDFPGVTPYDPAAGRLYLRYQDDWAAGGIATKQATLAIVNNRGASTADAETLTVQLEIAKRVGSMGVWEGSIPLKDLRITPGNDTAEFYILGNVTATVASHTPAGTPAGAVTDQILVAFPDVATKITLQDSKDTSVSITRTTEGLIVKVNDQSLSTAVDTLTVTLRCSGTGDPVTVMVIETGATTGQFRSIVVVKNEGTANLSDDTLTCRDRDIITARVTDPVYQTGNEITVTWDNSVPPTITYVRAPNGTDPIQSVIESDASSFKVVVEGTGKSLTARDTIEIKFVTTQGDNETFKAIETDVHSQIFEVIVPIGFVTGGVTTDGNGVVEGQITAAQLDNRVTATGTITINGQEVSKPIVLVAAFLSAVKAWIKDVDGDGRGDRVFVRFEKKAVRLPETLWAQWNTEDSAAGASPFVAVTQAQGKLSFNQDSTILIGDYSAPPFGEFRTSIPAGQKPKARLPMNALFAGQRPPIEDSIGPVIVSAVKTPADESNLPADNSGFNLDTLRITLSEDIQRPPVDMIRFSSQCGNYAGATPVIANSTPTRDPKDANTWIVIVNISNTAVPLVKNCVYLNAEPGKVQDLEGNAASKVGKPLEGKDRPRVIQLFRGFPPVAGMDPSSTRYQVSVQDTRDTLTGYAPDGILRWVPPVGFDPDVEYVDKVAKDALKNPGKAPVNENNDKPLQPFPIDKKISAIQVVSTSKYVAQVSIFDNLGHPLKSFVQSFGYRGEMDNDERLIGVRKGRVSYLVWNQKDRKGQYAGQGVYIWKVVFTFETGKQEIQYTRTGITRKPGD